VRRGGRGRRKREGEKRRGREEGGEGHEQVLPFLLMIFIFPSPQFDISCSSFHG
jgi:hypothetical protein